MPDSTAAAGEFPRGLRQAEGRARFAMDALLLAAFAARRKAALAVDLGSGCGAAGFGYLLLAPAGRVLGIERAGDQAAAARQNAELLGLADRYAVLEMDLAHLGGESGGPGQPGPESADLVLANPPYYRPGQGRLPRVEGRREALVQEPGGLEVFLDAAARLLRNRSPACFIYLAEGLLDLLEGLRRRRLEPKILLPVQSRAGEAARFVLVEARKNGGRGLALEAPLVLYADRGFGMELTPGALTFCPFLACNPGQKGTVAHDPQDHS